ncbi:MAG: GTPase [Halanaerobiales bacterium]
MPANLPPQYYEAEEVYRNADTAEEKIAALKEMLAIMPKHKGTEKLQANLRKKISNLKEEKEKKSETTGTYNPYKIEKEGAGQIILMGYPNTGKSSLLATFSNAKVKVADYPFTTSLPQPGMIPYEDIQIQVIDTPPLVPDDVSGPMIGAIQRADFPVLLIDSSSDKCLEQLSGTLDFLKSKRIVREEVPEKVKAYCPEDLLIFASKADFDGSESNLEVIKELYPDLNIIPLSIKKNINKDRVPELFFKKLNKIRVYSKEPGKDPDYEKPFVLNKNSTVLDFAGEIHRDFADRLKKARIWGSSRFEGQPVSQDYILQDQDVVELHIEK